MIEITNPLTGAEILAEFHNQPMDENFVKLETMIDRALEEARPKWQPIETAPIGTPILITDGVIVTVTILGWSGSYAIMYAHGFGGHEWEYNFRYKDAKLWMQLPKVP